MIDFAGACQLGFLGDLFQGIVCERQADVLGFVTGCVWWIPTKDLQKYPLVMLWLYQSVRSISCHLCLGLA